VPALFAQAYVSSNGKKSVLIFNKSSVTQTARVEWDGNLISGSIKQSDVSAADPFAVNTAATKQAVSSGPTAVTNFEVVTLKAYSATTLEWE
ncbi:MAG: hypothetical protein K2X47_01280, partial [Bdellovibrionales bacterium]|nr:hypothetical protein [Bdellovibrionales bacterium]